MPKKTSYLKLLLAAVFLQVMAASPVFSGAPLKINFQGRLDENGQPAEGSKTLIFKVYDAVSGGTLVWTSAAQALTLSNGVFSALLSAGSPAAISTGTFAGARYVEMSVDGVTLSPRQEMVSAPYALVAQALAADAELPASSIADGSVTDAKVSLTTAAINSGRFSDDRVLITTGAFAALNGADQLVKLDAAGKLPLLDGSALTNVPASSYSGSVNADQVAAGSLGAGVIASSVAVNKVYSGAIQAGSVTDAKVLLTTAAINSGRFSDDRVLITTGAFAALNGINQLVKLDGSGYLPALNGSALTNVNSAQFDAVASDTSTIAGNLAAEITNRGSADSALSTRLDDVATDTDTLSGQLSAKAVYADVIADTSTIAGNLAAEITNRGSADSALSARLDDVATDTDTLAGSLLSYAGLASTQAFTGANTFAGSSSFASTAAFTAQSDSAPGVFISSGLVVASGPVGINTAAPSSVLAVNGSVSLPIRTVAGDSAATLNDVTILVDATAGNPTTITLPDAAEAPGRIYIVKKIDGTVNEVSITADGGNVEDNAAVSIAAEFGSKTFQSNGTDWYQIGGVVP